MHRSHLFHKRPTLRATLALALSLATLALTLPALAGEGVFTMDHDAKTRSVTSAALSPDGSTTAFVRSVPRDPFAEGDGGAWAELHVAGPEEGRVRGFITGEVNVSRLGWMPDGSAITFLAKRHGDEERAFYAIPADGGEARRLIEHESAISSYSLSPDGKWVAFLARDKKDPQVEKRAKKGFKAEIYEEEPREVGVWIASLSEDGGEAPRRLDLEGSASLLRWSPAGKSLLLALAPTPLIDDEYMARTIHVVSVESGAIEATFEHEGKIDDLVWSPDGQRVAVIGAESIHDPNAGRLKVGAASGGALRDLLPTGYEGDATAVAFRDGETLVYIAHEGMLSKLVEVKVDGSGRRTLVDAEAPILRSLSLAKKGGRIALTGDAPKHPRELFHLETGAASVTRTTDSNPWLEELRLGKQEIVRYEARDGVMIEGLLFRPLDEKPGERYPLILVAHGGPEAHYSKGWVTRYSSPGHYGAARGFAVFYPNYRGSTGRGVEFSMAGQGDYAGAEFNDLVDGIRHLADEMKLVDKKRVGITGGSYGGFASAWGATALTEHFAASVMFVGISDQISKFGTTDIPNEMYLVHARSWPWERWDFYQERSPIFHAQKSKTPTLILHGKEDTRVHPSQSMILYRYMKTLGKTVRLVHYPGEGHGNRKAAARHDYRLRLMRWMEHYLVGEGGDPPAPQLELDLGGEDEKSQD